MKLVLVVACFVAVASAAVYEIIPAVEYDGEIYVPISRLPRSAFPFSDPRKSFHSPPSFGGAAQSQSKADAATSSQTGGLGGQFGSPFGGGGVSNAGATAGAKSGGGGFGSNSESSSNAQTQTFTGNGFTGSSSSASSSSSSSSGGFGGHGRLGGGSHSQSSANAESQSVS